ncbi:hypothetical protein BKA61DRAFT_570054 [Leptodontidium sp. MPI-SDFR-AT-0119]|nr:hypothetical protein BKA61DRAFT_570054 [Leptodontidium sp. MPI-SDFR-AT-0119]
MAGSSGSADPYCKWSPSYHLPYRLPNSFVRRILSSAPCQLASQFQATASSEVQHCHDFKRDSACAQAVFSSRQGSPPRSESKSKKGAALKKPGSRQEDSNSSKSEPVDRESKSKKEAFHITRKWPLSGLKKKATESPNSVKPGDHNVQYIKPHRGRRSSSDNARHQIESHKDDSQADAHLPQQSTASPLQQATIDETQGGDIQSQPESSISGLRQDLRASRLLSESLRDRIKELETGDRAAQGLAQQRIQQLEGELKSLYDERDEARKLNDDLLESLPPDLKKRIQEGITTKSRPDPTQHQKDVLEAFELHKYRTTIVGPLDRQSHDRRNYTWKLESEINMLNYRLESVEFDLKNKIQECDDTNGSLERLEHENETLATELTQSRRQRAETSRERSRVRKELNRVVQDKATTLAVLDAYFYDDAYFKRQFSSLRSTIKDWANRAFSSILPSKNKPPASSVTELTRISKDWEAYIDSDVHRATFVQAFVWDFLLLRVFGGTFWELPSSSEQYIKSLEEKSPRGTKDSSPENKKLYHEWRSAGARYAVPAGSEAQLKEKITASGLHQQIRDLLNPLQFWSVMGETQSQRFALQILTDAILLDVRALQQKADFVFLGAQQLWHMNGGMYAPDLMELRYGKRGSQKEQIVALVPVPMLGKRGDSQGRNYDRMTVIEKALVDVDVPRKKRAYFAK